MMLQARNLDVFYGRAQALHGVGLDVSAGEAVVLLGRNGAGKSTTLKALAGLLRPARGQVLFDNTDITGWEPFRVSRAGLGWVPEDRRVFADLTVLENLEVGRQRPRPGQASWTPERVFNLFPNLAELRHRPAARMSGGEQQMLTVARTLMGNPRLILLDEPSEGLAPLVVQQMETAIRALGAQGVTVLLAEQNLHLATAVAGRAVVLESGRVAWDGSVTALQGNEELRARYLAV